jgi:serine/threonine protein kinase
MQFGKSENIGGPAGKPGRFGRFYLQELINSGGAAEVWGATDADGRHYALRRMLNNSLFNFAERKRFFHGCEVLSKITDSEFVVNYIEHGKIEGTPYLLMDFVAGSNLKLLIGKSDDVLAENLAQIVLDMAMGLEQVHEGGFMHLDFKPENIIVTPNASVRLIDFDLAQPMSDEPRKMPRNPGTPAYMAPEHLQHQAIDQRADVYAFGATAYELLTGSKPFPGETPDEILRKQLARQLVNPRELNPDVPPALEKILVKCLESEMGDRYPFMSVVVRELEAALYL